MGDGFERSDAGGSVRVDRRHTVESTEEANRAGLLRRFLRGRDRAPLPAQHHRHAQLHARLQHHPEAGQLGHAQLESVQQVRSQRAFEYHTEYQQRQAGLHRSAAPQSALQDRGEALGQRDTADKHERQVDKDAVRATARVHALCERKAEEGLERNAAHVRGQSAGVPAKRRNNRRSERQGEATGAPTLPERRSHSRAGRSSGQVPTHGGHSRSDKQRQTGHEQLRRPK